MLRAAPSPMGTEMMTPTTVEVKVIVRLSEIPIQISREREVKSGCRNPATKRCARDMPSITRA